MVVEGWIRNLIYKYSYDHHRLFSTSMKCYEIKSTQGVNIAILMMEYVSISLFIHLGIFAPVWQI